MLSSAGFEVCYSGRLFTLNLAYEPSLKFSLFVMDYNVAKNFCEIKKNAESGIQHEESTWVVYCRYFTAKLTSSFSKYQ